MAFQKEALDLVLVPSGLVLMFSYHLFLLYRCLHLPHTTVIGYEKNDMRAWVDKVMQVSFILSKKTYFSQVMGRICYFCLVKLTGLELTDDITKYEWLIVSYIYGNIINISLYVPFQCFSIHRIYFDYLPFITSFDKSHPINFMP